MATSIPVATTLTEFGFCVSRDGRPLVTYAARHAAERAATVAEALHAITDSAVIDALLERQSAIFDPLPRPTFVHDGRPREVWA